MRGREEEQQQGVKGEVEECVQREGWAKRDTARAVKQR